MPGRGDQPDSAREWALLALSLGLLVAGGAAWSAGRPEAADLVWSIAVAVGLVAALAWVLLGAMERRLGVDLIAVLALAGTLLIGEPFAGAVITVMLATGRLLDARASARAHRDLSLLVARAPTRARLVHGGASEVVDVARVVAGDLILVGPGEVVPVDARLAGPASLDESALTGEPLPVEREAGEEVRSGSVNAGGPATMVAVATSDSSAYAQIVRLAEQAQAQSAPFVRLADRLAIIFVPLTLALAGLSWWVSGEAERAVAVLVVATPCPLLLAAPIAIVSGMGAAARAGVVVKGGGALEALARGTVLLLDKTGTLTSGRPAVESMTVAEGWSPDEALALAASLEQVSPHVVADALVAQAQAHHLVLTLPREAREEHGSGISGLVGERIVRVGREGAGGSSLGAPPGVGADGELTVGVDVDGRPVASLRLVDPVRPEAADMVTALRKAGVNRVVLVTGDRWESAEAVGRAVGVDAVVADCDPAAKAAVVARERAWGPTIMVGDGVNDAPALAAADVGVALAARGRSASGEVADVVLTVDRLDALADAARIARRARAVAGQAAGVGMGLSAVAMVAAAAGMLAPAAGAVLQEGIDVIAIMLALRSVGPRSPGH